MSKQTENEARAKTDFSHLDALEQRAKNIRQRMLHLQKNDAQWNAQAIQLFQTEQEIAAEREFLGLEELSTDELYARFSAMQ